MPAIHLTRRDPLVDYGFVTLPARASAFDNRELRGHLVSPSTVVVTHSTIISLSVFFTNLPLVLEVADGQRPVDGSSARMYYHKEVS